MKHYSLTYLFLLTVFATFAQVTPGVEVLEEMDFAPLKGKRVGLITNPTGVDRTLRSTIDILNDAPDVELVALFSPEHGIRGNFSAGNRVADDVDPVTGIKIHSLHGRNLAPTPEMLRGIDVMVYDIQDVGARSYTYVSTLGRSMAACARAGVEFMVLDRPDPLGGIKVEGPVVAQGEESFVGQYPIPYLYALTPGELAKLLIGEGMLGSGNNPKLTVIEMDGWQRDMLFADTGLPWVLPSPNIPTMETALYYPATGIAGELDGLSIGVGYTLPFHLFAVPGTDGIALAGRLNALQIPGVAFRPITFKPGYSKHAGSTLSGVEVYIMDAEEAPLTLISFYLLQELEALYPGKKLLASEKAARLSMMDKVIGDRRVRQQFSRRYKVDDILLLWHKDTDKFTETKQKYHLYR
ncbi:MAG: DUF1343 domain-containing protein [Bacteroides sp.]|nr:DUF1343 domain-containing protein [Bacteroides sp.]